MVVFFFLQVTQAVRSVTPNLNEQTSLLCVYTYTYFSMGDPWSETSRLYLLTQHNVRVTEWSQWFRAGLTSPWAAASSGETRLQSSNTQKHPNCQTCIYIQAHTKVSASCFRSKQFRAHWLDNLIITCFDNLCNSAQVEGDTTKTEDKTRCFPITFNQIQIQRTLEMLQMITIWCAWFSALEAFCSLWISQATKLVNKLVGVSF